LFETDHNQPNDLVSSDYIRHRIRAVPSRGVQGEVAITIGRRCLACGGKKYIEDKMKRTELFAEEKPRDGVEIGLANQ